MSRSGGAPREIALPAGVFNTLCRELEGAAGRLHAVHALHDNGHRAGLEASVALQREAGGGARSLGKDAFWRRLSEYFSKRGWGTLEHASVHPAVGILLSRDWAEAEVDDPSEQASCSFSSGYLSGILSELAGGPIAVLEVSCRARGDETCAFAFGSEAAIHDLYGRLLEGAELDAALEQLS